MGIKIGGSCSWRAAEPAAPTVGAGNSGDTPLGRAAGCAAPTGSHWFRRFPPSLLFPLPSSLFPLPSSLFPLHSLLFFFSLLFRSGPMTVLAQRKNCWVVSQRKLKSRTMVTSSLRVLGWYISIISSSSS